MKAELKHMVTNNILILSNLSDIVIKDGRLYYWYSDENETEGNSIAIDKAKYIYIKEYN